MESSTAQFASPRRVFTAPLPSTRPSSSSSSTSSTGPSGSVETLYNHPNAKIIAFTATARTVPRSPTKNGGSPTDEDQGTLSWSSQLERTIAVGRLTRDSNFFKPILSPQHQVNIFRRSSVANPGSFLAQEPSEYTVRLDPLRFSTVALLCNPYYLKANAGVLKKTRANSYSRSENPSTGESNFLSRISKIGNGPFYCEIFLIRSCSLRKRGALSNARLRCSYPSLLRLRLKRSHGRRLGGLLCQSEHPSRLRRHQRP